MFVGKAEAYPIAYFCESVGDREKKVLLTLTSGCQHDPVSQTALLHPQLLAPHRPRQRRLPEDERRGADNAGVNFTNIL